MSKNKNLSELINFVSVGTSGTSALVSLKGSVQQQGFTSSIVKAGTSGILIPAIENTDYQGPLSVTTAGTSGASTLVGNTLNIPIYENTGPSGTSGTSGVDGASGTAGTSGSSGINVGSSAVIILGGGTNSSVRCGVTNTASGNSSAALGGSCNTACGSHSTVGGGYFNTASSYYATVSGGYCNTAKGGYSTISGGYSNCACGNCSSVGGGRSNLVCGAGSVISGGRLNLICANVLNASIGGGITNIISISHSNIGGGYGNSVSAEYSTISGGNINRACGTYSTIGGGQCNTAIGCYSFVGGGQCNKASGIHSSVVDGFKNATQGFNSFIGSGNCNNVCNATSGCLAYGAVVVGGVGNNTTGGTWTAASCAFTVAPTICDAGCMSFVGGGFQNRATVQFSAILGGLNNTVSGYYSSILGGSSNTVSGCFSSAFGCGLTASAACTFYTNNSCACQCMFATAFFETSDCRLKNIYNTSSAYDGIHFNQFSWKTDVDNKSCYGYIAQEVEKILPNAVHNNVEGFKQVDYNQVNTYKLSKLEERIASLEEKLKKYEA